MGELSLVYSLNKYGIMLNEVPKLGQGQCPREGYDDQMGSILYKLARVLKGETVWGGNQDRADVYLAAHTTKHYELLWILHSTPQEISCI